MSQQQTKALGPSVVSFEATVCAGPEPLRSPVSGLPCAHWRLRIVQHITPRMQLVHEMASPDALELSLFLPPSPSPAGAGPDAAARAPARVRLDPESARIHAVPVLHREGTPGALAAARHFALAGPITVEEVIVRYGEEVVAEGILDDPDAVGGPFRATGRGLELLDATVRLPSRSLGPALLPWALGTAAALLGTTAAATYAAWRYHVAHMPAGAVSSSHATRLPLLPVNLPATMRPPEPPRPRMP